MEDAEDPGVPRVYVLLYVRKYVIPGRPKMGYGLFNEKLPVRFDWSLARESSELAKYGCIVVLKADATE